MLAADPKQRLPLTSFVESEIFNDVATKSLVFLQHILDKDDQTKAIFFKGLTTIIGQFSPRILEFKVRSQFFFSILFNDFLKRKFCWLGF
jgi:hypothetical protein